jgi:peptidoglycan-N-acetylglucosamine deacetylase
VVFRPGENDCFYNLRFSRTAFVKIKIIASGKLLMMGPVIVGVAAAGATIAAAGVGRYAVLDPRATLLAPSICRGPQDRPAIALTFDDGPSESTPSLLEILLRYNLKATFFQCGLNVRRLPQVSREVCAAGHEVGNHSHTHPHFWFKSPGFIGHELVQAQEAIEQAAGIKPVLFRSPFGIRWFGMRHVQKRLGLTGVTWTAIGYDWVYPAEQVIEVLCRQAGNGAIFCLHDGRRTRPNPDTSATINAVATLIPMLRDRGFYFESVGRMLQRGKAQIAGPCPG